MSLRLTFPVDNEAVLASRLTGDNGTKRIPWLDLMDLVNLMVTHEKLIVIFAVLALILGLRFHRNKG